MSMRTLCASVALATALTLSLCPPARCQSPAPWLGTNVLHLQEDWGLTHPAPITLLPSGKTKPAGAISQFLYGIRNHPELHSPLRLRVHYPVAGKLIAHVLQTSGYGGAGLRISIDGRVALKRDFPGDTNSALTKYAGDYSVNVPAGAHEIVLDNQGADWTRIDEIRLTNYDPWRVSADKATSQVTVRLFGDDGKPLADATVQGETIGKTWRFTDRGDGVYVSPAFRDALPRGTYPLYVSATKGGRQLLDTLVKLAVLHRRLMLGRIAFPVGEPVALSMTYTDFEGKPVSGAAVSVKLRGKTLRLSPAGKPGTYFADAGTLPAGKYPIVLQASSPAHEESTWIIVYKPSTSPGTLDHIVALRRDGWFGLRDGEPFTPLGFASIHVFQPTLDSPTIDGWLQSSWNLADPQKVADWLGLLSTQGINVVRIGLTVRSDGVPGDMGGYVQPEFLARFRQFVDTAGSFGMRVLPVLYWGHWSTFGLNNVPAYNPLMHVWSDWYTNAQAIKLQQAFTRAVVRPFATDGRIFAWEPMNEIRPEVDGKTEVPIAWTNDICQAIRQVDPNHLITISPLTEQPYYHIQFARKSGVSFINYHFYADYTTPRRGIADRVAVCTRLNQTGGKPAIVGEAGTTGSVLGCHYPDAVRRATRDIYWASVLSGATGCIGWDGGTTSPQETATLARILGVTGWYGKHRDQAPVAVTYSNVKTDLGPLIDAEKALSDRGVWYDDRPASADLSAYKLRLTPEQAEARARRLPRLVEATPPYAAIPMVADGGKWVLIYLRNEGGFDGGGCRWATPTDLTVYVNRPGRHRLVVWDLDSGRRVLDASFVDRGPFRAKDTRSDYALWVAPEPE